MPVVYNGVPGTGQGDLFQGLKIWVAQRVPQRARWIDLVKGNGGEVVKLEKTADMLIADNVKVAGVSPPPGSYMWSWIDMSVKNGFLQDKTDYLIGRRQGSTREPGTAEQTKVGRSAFTSTDDLILTKWVVAGERIGNGLSGTSIYRALEERHPNHTWQSWRERWIKILRNRPRPSFSDEEIQLEVDQHRAQSSEAAAGPHRTPRRNQPSVAAHSGPQSSSIHNGPANPTARAPKAAAPVSSGHARRTGRVFFTEEDDQLLLNYIKGVRQKNLKNGREMNKNLVGNVIYQDFAETHPTHSWHSWRDRWIRHLSILEAVGDSGPDEASSADPQEAPQSSKRQLRQSPATGVVEPPATEGTKSPAPGPSSTKHQPNPKSDDERLKRNQRERREARAALLIENTWRDHVVRGDMARLEAAVIPLQSLMRGYVARLRTANLVKAREAGSESGRFDLSQDDDQCQDAENDLPETGVDSQEMLPEDRDPREQFYDDLQVILGAIDVQVDREPVINGHRIDLWDLYRLARQQECELEARDWKLVTEGLGFQPIKGIVWKVQACYLQNLAEFEHHIKIFEGNDGIEEEEGEQQAETGHDTAAESLHLTSDAVTAPKQPVADPSSPAYRSSPPIAGSKRSLGHADLISSGSVYPSSGPRKRRRVDRTSVIPPTPEDKLGLPNNSFGGVATSGQSSPLMSRAIANRDEIEIISDDESDGHVDQAVDGDRGQDELPIQPDPLGKGFVEPETQDWHISKGPFFLDNENDVCPSQQLHSESDAIKSLDQGLPDSHSAAAEKDNRASPVAANLGVLGGPSARVTRLNSEGAAVPTPLASARRVLVTGKVKKRTLPASYQRQPASTAAATAIASTPNQQTIRQSQPQPNGKVLVQPPSTAPVHTTNGDASRSTPVNAHTPTTAMQLSTNRSPVFSTSAPPERTGNEDAPASPESETWDEAFVEAQISYYQARGHKKDHIVQAIGAATMSRGPMVVALRSLSVSGSLPQNEAGVWTAQDCRDLRTVKNHERQVEKGKGIAELADGKVKVMAWNLEKKHGKKRMEDRWKFMQMLDKAEGAE